MSEYLDDDGRQVPDPQGNQTLVGAYSAWSVNRMFTIGAVQRELDSALAAMRLYQTPVEDQVAMINKMVRDLQMLTGACAEAALHQAFGGTK